MYKVSYVLLALMLASCSLGGQKSENEKISFFKILSRHPSQGIDYKGITRNPDDDNDYKIISDSKGIEPEPADPSDKKD